jgi:hypothetical protein
MSERVQSLVERCSNDADFRAEFLGDPEGVSQDLELTIAETESAYAQVQRQAVPVTSGQELY